MSSSVTLEAKGLNFQPNQLSAPSGSLIEASNCVIRRDNVLESRRGFQLYGNSFGTITDRTKQLMTYKQTILRHYGNTLQYDSDGEGTFVSFNFNSSYTFTVTSSNATIGAIYTDSVTGSAFTVTNTIASGTTLLTTGLTNSLPSNSGTLTKSSGTGDSTITFSAYKIPSGDSVTEAQTGLRTKYIESNGNLYFTSSEGIRKVSAITESNFSTSPGYITKAGGVKAIDVTASLVAPLGFQAGFLPQDSAVGYRVLWLTNDINNNLIQGTPSQPVQIYNFQSDLMLSDYMNLLGQLDNINQSGSIIRYGQFIQTYGLTSGALASNLQISIEDVASQLDYSIEFASDAVPGFTYTFTVTSANATVGATYTNNTSTFTVVSTISGSTTLICTSSGSPLASGTLTKTSGAGDSTISFSSYSSINVPLQISSISLDNILDLATVTFSGSPTLANYFSVGDSIFLTSTSSTPNNIPINGFTLDNLNTQIFDSSNTDYIFTISSPSSTVGVGAVYQDSGNSQNFTVLDSITTGATMLVTSPVGTAPGASGTLTKQSGTGPATITYSSFIISSAISLSHSTITINNHGFILGQPVQFTPGTGGTLPTGINQGTTYYIINPTTNTFQITLTRGAGLVTFVTGGLGTDKNTSVYVIPTGTINGVQTVTAVGSTTIQFSTLVPTTASAALQASGPATGSVSITNSKIISYKFENITNTVGIAQPSSLVGLQVTVPTTNGQLGVIQDALSRFIETLQGLPIGVVSSTLNTEFLSPLQLTNSANVTLNITIPQDAQNSNYFFQIYRSDIVTATLTDDISNLVPDDEMALVYEAYPTPTEITAQQISVVDETPVAFEGANLYTNAFSGEGISQANDIPPFALDINKFAGSVFYANTKTKQQQLLQLLPVTNLVTDFNLGNNPSIVISNGIATNTYNFELGVQQIQQITADTYANTTDHGFVRLYSPDTSSTYFFRLNKTTPSGNPSGFTSGTDVLVDIDISSLSGGTAAQIAQRLCNNINTQVSEFTGVIDASTNKVDVTNASEGIVTTGTINSLGVAWAISVTTAGNGENTVTNSVLLSNLISPAQAIDATSRSLVRVINRNSQETIYAYYLSGSSTVPGQILLESRDINVSPFYLLASNSTVGTSFNPDLSPGDVTITGFSNSTNKIATSGPHGLTAGQQVLILETDGSSTISGLKTVTIVDDSTHFEIGPLASSGTTAVFLLATSSVFSSDQEKKNRIYFSKTDQPEAVPIVNYFDIGALDKAILRIFPLRDSLFVFKEDGLYRISGTGIPFITSLFDGSCIVEAPDSLALANNVIYCWTSQGISTATEAGVKFNISRPIDTDILKKATSQYTNFKTVTWGIGYESDNSYLCSTVVNPTDTEPQITYRYSTLTNTWTTYDKNVTCGVVNASGDDKMYLGAGDTNFVEQERKDYLRTDYADRQFNISLNAGSYFGTNLQLPIANIDDGDVLTQSPYVTIFLHNALLQKLDLDPGTPIPNFFSTLQLSPGANIHSALKGSGSLTNKLDTELATGGTYDALVGSNTDFVSIQGYYNAIIAALNMDATLAFTNYTPIANTTTYEVIVTNVTASTMTVSVSLALPFVQGVITVYKAINAELTYSPSTLGDPLSLKHFRESTVMFENKAFTTATVSYATDLLPAFQPVPFNGDGSRIFGENSFFGNGFFGGASNSAPMRTLIPRDCQRCRYMVVKFNHNIARENFSLFGITLTGDVTSTRGYR